MNTVVSKRYFLPKSNSLVLFIILFFAISSCKKEKITETPQQLKINKIFTEQTYGDNARVYTNDSLFCIYLDDNNFKVWKNGFFVKDNKALLSLIKRNDSSKMFRTYKFQSELMNLDFKNYSNKAVTWDTKDYQIRKNGENYFLYKKGYSKIKLPIRHYESMDWITFNSMDINNDKIPELFIFNESYNDREDQEYGKMIVYEIK
jgi:DNA-directed RNA polymerase beta' subunit